jgi:hypothetical protein
MFWLRLFSSTMMLGQIAFSTVALSSREQSFVPEPLTIFSSRSRTRKSTRLRAAGGSGTSTQTANQATRRYARLALPATRRLLVILSSRVTHLNNRSIGKRAGTSLETNLWRQPAAGRPIFCAIETNHASRLALLYSCREPREGTVISGAVSVSNCARSTNSSSADRGCLQLG